MSFTADFLDFMPDIAYAKPGTMDGYGAFIASGAQLALQCRIEGSQRLTRDTQGREVVSSVQIIVGAVDGDAATLGNLTVDLHRYYIPSRYVPSGALVALSVEHESDEDGPCYEVVYLP